jgi:hypothetical protein
MLVGTALGVRKALNQPTTKLARRAWPVLLVGFVEKVTSVLRAQQLRSFVLQVRTALAKRTPSQTVCALLVISVLLVLLLQTLKMAFARLVLTAKKGPYRRNRAQQASFPTQPACRNLGKMVITHRAAQCAPQVSTVQRLASLLQQVPVPPDLFAQVARLQIVLPRTNVLLDTIAKQVRPLHHRAQPENSKHQLACLRAMIVRLETIVRTRMVTLQFNAQRVTFAQLAPDQSSSFRARKVNTIRAVAKAATPRACRVKAGGTAHRLA